VDRHRVDGVDGRQTRWAELDDRNSSEVELATEGLRVEVGRVVVAVAHALHGLRGVLGQRLDPIADRRGPVRP
jgi:hypothetical protein